MASDQDGLETSRDSPLVDANSLVTQAKGLESQGDLVGAEALYRQVAILGDIRGVLELGCLLLDRGDLESAEEWFRKGIDQGDSASAFNLALVLEGKGDFEGAETL